MAPPPNMMRGPNTTTTTTITTKASHRPPPLHTLQILRRTVLNRIFGLVYLCAILALFYHQISTLLSTTSISSTTTFLQLTLLFSNFVLAFMWATTQSFRMNPIKRQVYPENLNNIIDVHDYPKLDVFICTADPYKEPPMNVVNTALSVMAYDYPFDKVSVYVSDDGGSELTLFAFMEAAKFARHWLPYCRVNRIEERCPEAYFRTNNSPCAELDEIKVMYESIKIKVERVVERGRVVDDDRITMNDQEREVFNKWTAGFSRQDHPTVIQVLLKSETDKDMVGHGMPNLVYVSREKRRTSHHRYKAGALNALLRVSATMTNAPVVLTLDCDMYSNNPKTPHQVLCYLLDPTNTSKQNAYVQFPQRFHGINNIDLYGGENKRLFQINPMGMDGLAGTTYVGTGCFFNRRAFFGGPSSFLSPESPDLNPNHVVEKSISSNEILQAANRVAGCKYEDDSIWGSKMGFRYGSLVEDYYTGYRLQCEGWESVFYNPDRPAFLGDVPINLHDVLSQNKRWSVGLLEVVFSKYCPVTFGAKSMGFLMGLCYSHYAFWPTWSIPITTYAFLPQIALLNGVSMFPKVSDPWFYLYVFLFLGAYIQDFLDFVLAGGTIRRWWNDQRMWLIRGVSSYLFGWIDFVVQSIGISIFAFNVTSKVIDDEESKRYEQQIFEFGVHSPLFVPMVSTAMINLIAFIVGITRVLVSNEGDFGEMFVQLFLCGFVMVNCWPIYQAIALRSDKGKMPTKTSVVSAFLVLAICFVASLVF